MAIRNVLEDVDGSFARFLRTAPREVRQALAAAVKKSAFAVGQRMKALAPVGPDAPHLREDVEVEARGLTARVGYLTAKPAAPGSDATQPDVALYNEYAPNAQPFMRPAFDSQKERSVGIIRTRTWDHIRSWLHSMGKV